MMSGSDALSLLRRSILVCTLSLGLILGGGEAAAAEPTPPEREAARTLLLSGREKRKHGQLEEALADFEKAHAIMRVPTTGLDLGKAQQELGLLVEARTSFLEAARHPAKPNESQAFKRARKEAKQLAEEIVPRLATLTIAVPSGAEPKVKIDGAEISSSSIGVPLKVNPGKHEIVAALDDDEKRQSIELVDGEIKTVELRLDPRPGSPEKPRREKEKRSAGARRKDVAARRSSPSETSTSPLVWIGGGTAAVGVAVGTVTGLMAFGVYGDVQPRCSRGVQCPPETHGDIDRGATLGTISTVAFVVAGVGAGVLVYGLLNPSVDTTKTAAKAAPRWIATPFGVTGSF